MSGVTDDRLSTKRFEPESPLGEVRSPQFSLKRLLVFVGVAALAAALYGERIRVNPPITLGTHVMLIGWAPLFLVLATWRRKKVLALGGETTYRLRLSYWPLSSHRRLTTTFMILMFVVPMVLLPIRLVSTVLTLAVLGCLAVLSKLILEALWRADLRDTLLCEDGIIRRGWLFTSWDQLQGFQLSSEHPPSRVELSMRAPGIWPTNFCITLFLPEHDPQSVLEFLEQKASERTE